MTLVRTALSLLFAFSLAGCSTPRPTGYLAIEDQITARGGLGENGIFHDVVYNPESISLSFPGYIIGLDKGRRRAVLKGNSDSDLRLFTDPPDEQWGIKRFKERVRTDPKVHYISHIIRNFGRPYGAGNCILYSIYRDWGSVDGLDTLVKNNPDDDLKKDCDGRAPTFGSTSNAYNDSVIALEVLKSELESQKLLDGKNYTHVLVVVMGWNTRQIEAIQNYNAIVSHIKHASETDESFRPLFIGVTWASEWTAEWFEPAVRLISFPAKANDADEVGLSWLGAVLNVISKQYEDKPKVAIGHSFGARALASALCTGPQISLPPFATISNGESEEISATKTAASKPQPMWDLFLGWQPAFPMGRFDNNGARDGFRYPYGCARVRSMVMTASVNDQAVRSDWGFDMIGASSVRAEACNATSANRFQRKLACIDENQVRNSPKFSIDWTPDALNYVDASNIVWFSQPNTGGGAHSDIYRAVHGRLAWSAIRRLALPPDGIASTATR